MDFRYIADQRNQQLTPNKPLGTGVYQRGMEGLHENPLVWSAALQKYVPAQSLFDSLSPEEQAQYLFGQTKQNGIYSSGAPVSQTFDANPSEINVVNTKDVQQDNASNDSNNVDSQPPYVPLEKDTSNYLGQSLFGQLTNPKQKLQFANLLNTSQSQPNTSGQNMAQDNSSSFMRNILGTVPSYYGGLLGAEEAKALQSRANTQGLLGATIGLLGGMGTRGTTAAQNIAGALSGGLQASQGAIQQGITNYGQQQQLMLQQRQQAGIAAMKIKYPDLADEFDTNPAGAFRIISERENASRKITSAKPGEVLFDATGRQIAAVPAADKTQGRILTSDEATQYGLPATGKYQVNANGEISLISGTGPSKETSFTGEYGNLALKMFKTADASKLTDQQRIELGKEAERLNINKGVNVTTNVNAGKAFGTEFGKGVAESVGNTYSAAQGAQSTLSAIQNIRPLIQSGVYAGPLSSVPRVVDQLATSLGITGKDDSEKLRNTAVAMQGLASLELSAAQAMKGQGAITENERSLIKRAAAGDLQTFTQPEVLSLLNAL